MNIIINNATITDEQMALLRQKREKSEKNSKIFCPLALLLGAFILLLIILAGTALSVGHGYGEVTYGELAEVASEISNEGIGMAGFFSFFYYATYVVLAGLVVVTIVNWVKKGENFSKVSIICAIVFMLWSVTLSLLTMIMAVKFAYYMPLLTGSGDFLPMIVGVIFGGVALTFALLEKSARSFYLRIAQMKAKQDAENRK